MSFCSQTSGNMNGSMFVFIRDLVNDGSIEVQFFDPVLTGYFSNRYDCKIEKGKWFHFALVRETNESTLKAYLNGKQLYKTFDALKDWTFQFNSSNPSRLGALLFSGYNLNFCGKMSGFRITKEARYFGDFDPTLVELVDEPYINETNLLLHFDDKGKSPVLSSAVSDYKGHLVTINGDVTTSSYTPYNKGTSVYFDGSGDTLSYAYDSRFDISTGDFTIEMFVCPKSDISQYQTFMLLRTSNSPIGLWFGMNYGKVNALIGDSTAPYEVNLLGTSNLLKNKWTHIALTRTGNEFQLFQDFVLVASSIWSGTIYVTTSSNLQIGGEGVTGYNYTGFIDDLKITKGVSRYYSGFVDKNLPTDGTVLLLRGEGPNNNVGITDETGKAVTVFGDTKISTTQKKFGNSSIYLDGNGDYLTLPKVSDFEFSGNFSIHTWVYPVAAPGSGSTATLYGRQDNSSALHLIQFRLTSAMKLECVVRSGGSIFTFTGTQTVPLNTWSYVSCMRYNGGILLFLNGVLDVYANHSNPIIPSNAFPSIGALVEFGGSVNYYLNGYIDDFVIHNTAEPLFAPKFSLQASKFVSDSNTKMLIHGDAISDDSGNSIAVNGNVSVSTTQKKFGNSSIYFDGSGDYLQVPYSNDFTFSGDFTIEMWFYLTSLASFPQTLIAKDTFGSNFDINIVLNSLTQLGCYTNKTNSSFLVTIPSIALNTWNHVALVRSSGKLYYFLNGVLYGTSSINITNDSQSFLTIGCASWNNPSSFFNGYIDELRISDSARYSANFTPPVSGHSFIENEQNQIFLLHGEGVNNSTAIYDNYGIPVSVFGNAIISTTQKKFGNSSIYLDGNGDCLTADSVCSLLAGEQSFTIEGWFYQISSGTYNALFSFNTSAGGNRLLLFNQLLTIDKVDYTFSNNLFGNNQWVHIALVKANTIINIYVNGSLMYTKTDVIGFSLLANDKFSIGQDWDGASTSDFFYGYIDDFRITKGVKYPASWATQVQPVLSNLPYGNQDTFWNNVSFYSSFDEQPFVYDELRHKMTTRGYVELKSDQSKSGSFSAYFGDYGFITTPHHDDFYLPGDFTIEFWVRPERLVGQQYLLTKSEGYGIGYPTYTIMTDGAQITFVSYSSNAVGGLIVNAPFGTLQVDQWAHIAVTRAKDKWTGYLNGVPTLLVTSTSIPYNNTANGLAIGGDCTGYSTRFFKGYIDELRITKGVSRYSDSFVPETRFSHKGFGDPIMTDYYNMHLRCNGSEFYNESGLPVTVTGNVQSVTSVSKFGGSSTYFDGSGCYLSMPNSQVFDFGTGDFTFQTWFLIPIGATYVSNQCSIICAGRQDTTSNGGGWNIHLFYSDSTPLAARLEKCFNGGTIPYVAETTRPSRDQWHHFAITRTSGVLRFFLNGVKFGETNVFSGVSLPVPNNLSILIGTGGNSSNLAVWPGWIYLDDLQVIKGFSKYQSDFPVPSQPISDTTGDPFWNKLIFALPLTGHNGSALFYDVSPSQLAVTNDSNSVIYNSTTMSRFGKTLGTAAQFNGSSSSLTIATNLRSADLRADWTFEGWLYSTASGSNRYLMHYDYIAGTNPGCAFYKNTTNKLQVDVSRGSSTSVSSIVGVNAIPDNQWVHFAFVKRGNIITIYLDGNYDSSGVLSEYIKPPTASTPSIRIGASLAGGSNWSGYLQNFRLTHEAKYLTPFLNSKALQGRFRSKPIIICDGESFIERFGSQLVPSGNASVSSDTSVYGTKSFKFTGPSDIIDVYPLNRFAFQNIDFSIDFWLKTSTTTGGLEYIYRQLNQTEVSLFFKDDLLTACVGISPRDDLQTGLMRSDFSTFRHVRLAKQDMLIVLFVDGTLVAKKRIGVDIYPRSFATVIGHFNGTNGSTSFVNSSVYPITMAPSGNVQNSTTQTKFGLSSAYFDGTGDILSVSSTPFHSFGLSDFTIEMWCNIDLSFSSTGGDTFIQVGADGNVGCFEVVRYLKSNPAGIRLEYWTTQWVPILDILDCGIQSNTWFNLVVQRKSGFFMVFIDGVLKGTSEKTNIALTPANPIVTLGGRSANIYNMKGYIDEFRLSPWRARYSGNFSVQSTPFDENLEPVLIYEPQYVRFGGFSGYLDNLRVFLGESIEDKTLKLPTEKLPSYQADFYNLGYDPNFSIENQGVVFSSNKTLGGNSVAYFDGKSCLRMMRSEDISGYTDFSISFWVYFQTDNCILFSMRDTTGACPFVIQRTSQNTRIYVYTNTWNDISVGTLPGDTWLHLAFCRIGQNIICYVNGKETTNTTLLNISRANVATNISIGCDYIGASNYFTGYMSGIEICSGFSKYQKSFVPKIGLLEPTEYNFSFFLKDQIGLSSLIAYYKMDDSGTILSDSSLFSQNMNAINPQSIQTNQTTLIPFDSSYSLSKSIQFSGGYYQGGFSSVTGKSELTIQFFIKSSISDGIICEKQGSFFVSLVAGKIVFNVYTNNGIVSVGSVLAINDNVSHLVICCFDSVSSVIFIDGKLDSVKNDSVIQKNEIVSYNFQGKDILYQMIGSDFSSSKVSAFCFGPKQEIIDAPFPGRMSLLFDGNYHIEVPGITLAYSKSRTIKQNNHIDFTIDCWIKQKIKNPVTIPLFGQGCSDSTTGTTLYRSGFNVLLTANQNIQITAGNLGQDAGLGYYSRVSSSTIPFDTWTYISIVIVSGFVKLYINGVQSMLTPTVAANNNQSIAGCVVYSIDPFIIGGGGFFNGGTSLGTSVPTNISGVALFDFRLVKGSVYYQVPSTPLQSSVSKYNNGTGQMFGLMNVLSPSRKISKTPFIPPVYYTKEVLSGTFTIDLWVFCSNLTQPQQLISQKDLVFSVKNTFLTIFSGTEVTGTVPVVENQWNHIAFVRNGQTCRGFLNGQLAVTHTAFVEPSRGVLCFGSNLAGYLDAIRIRFSEVWQTSFTPPIESDYINDQYHDESVLFLSFPSQQSSDQFSNNVVFQLGMDGINNTGQLSSYYDDLGNRGLTVVGNTTFYNTHFRNNGSQITLSGNQSFVVEKSPAISFNQTFTFELAFYPTNLSTKMTIIDRRPGCYVYLDVDGKLYVKIGSFIDFSSSALSVSWNALAICHSIIDNSWRVFVNGSQIGTTVIDTSTVDESTNWVFGKTSTNADYFIGALSDIQFLRNSVKYISTYSITEPLPLPLALENDYTSLLLHFDGNNGDEEFVDSSRYSQKVRGMLGAKISTTQSKFGGSSLYISNVNGCGLTIDSTPQLDLGNSDFTIECWFRLDPVPSSGWFYTLLAQWSQTSVFPGPWWILRVNYNKLDFTWFPNSNSTALITGTTTITNNVWYHVSVTKKRDVFSIWLNGSLEARTPHNKFFGDGYNIRKAQSKSIPLSVGNYFTSAMKFGVASSNFIGHIDEIRIIKGVSLYNNTFTSSTVPYTLSQSYPYRDQNVSLFLDGRMGEVDDFSIEKNKVYGNAEIGSLRGLTYATFDGNGDAIRNTSIVGDFGFGYDDFCIDLWVNPINGGKGQNWSRIFEFGQLNVDKGGLSLVTVLAENPTNILVHDTFYGGSEVSINSGEIIPNNTWTHIAITRESGLFGLWINGKLKKTAYPNNTLTSTNVTITLSNNNKTANNPTGNWISALSRDLFDSNTSNGVYFEVVYVSGQYFMAGISRFSSFFDNFPVYPGTDGNGYGYHYNGNKYFSSTGTAYGSAYAPNDVIGVAVKNNKVYFSKNGVWQASSNPVTEVNPAFSITSGLYRAGAGLYSSSGTLRSNASEFSYPMPAGFVSLQEVSGYYLYANKLSIGANNVGGESFYGSIDNFRITRGVPRFRINWSEFSLASDQNSVSVMLLMNMNSTSPDDSSFSLKNASSSNVIMDQSIKRFGSSSARFNGLTSFISLDDSVDWYLGINSFVIEFWYRFDTMPTGTTVSDLNSQQILSQNDGTNIIHIIATKTGFIFEAQGVTVSAATIHDRTRWHHFALVRNQTSFIIYIDGCSAGSSTATVDFSDISSTLLIGKSHASNKFFSGWIDSLRITKGASRYPDEFGFTNPPVSLPEIKNRIQIESDGMYQVTDIETPVIEGKRCVSFGNRDILETAKLTGVHEIILNQSYTHIMNKFDWTFEGWFYPLATGTTKTIFMHGINTAGGVSFFISKTELMVKCNRNINKYQRSCYYLRMESRCVPKKSEYDTNLPKRD